MWCIVRHEGLSDNDQRIKFDNPSEKELKQIFIWMPYFGKSNYKDFIRAKNSKMINFNICK